MFVLSQDVPSWFKQLLPQTHYHYYGVVAPNEQVIAADKCDFEEELWKGGKEIVIPLTNWSDLALLIKKQSHIGKIDQAELVTQNDPHWRAEL